MGETRRTWLEGTATALLGVGLAGCSGIFRDGDGESTSAADQDGQPTANTAEDGDVSDTVDIDGATIAVTAEWNAIRTRLRDPVILGHADEYTAGRSVAANIFERFEHAAGDYNAHEMLEETSEERYAGFEEGLGDLRAALEDHVRERLSPVQYPDEIRFLEALPTTTTGKLRRTELRERYRDGRRDDDGTGE